MYIFNLNLQVNTNCFTATPLGFGEVNLRHLFIIFLRVTAQKKGKSLISYLL